MGLGVAAALLALPAIAQQAPLKTPRIAMTSADVPTTAGIPNNGFEGMRFLGYARAHTRIMDNPPWLFIVHDLNPRAMHRRVRGFTSAQSWFQDLLPVDIQ